MSDTVNVGLSVVNLDSSPAYQEITKVIINLDEGNYVEAGDDTGGELECSSPFATQEIANDLLNRVVYFQYNPFTAGRVFIDPAAEIGDGIIVGKVNSALFSMNNKFGTLFTADCEAPTTKEIDHEYPYKPKEDRQFQRTMREVGSRITQTASAIEAEVSAREAGDNTLSTFVQQTAERILLEFYNSESDTKKYIRYEDGKIILGIENDPFQLIVANNKLSLYDTENEVAYVANNQFLTNHMVVKSELDLGGYQLDATNGIAYRWRGRD